jgi:Predicted glycosyltransferases
MIDTSVDFSKWNSKESCFEKYKHIQTELIYGKHVEGAKVSIIILSYRRTEGLIKALESAIAQDFTLAYEILVMDDSGEITEIDEIMQKYCRQYEHILYYRHVQNLGEPGNWNRSCELCKTQWYCLLHDDDLMKPNYLTKMMQAVQKNPDYGMIGVYVDFEDEREDKKEAGFLRKSFDMLIQLFVRLRKGKAIPLTITDNMKDIYAISTCLFLNREKVIAVGGSRDEYFPNSDSVFNAKMNYYYSIAFMPMVLATRGVYENQSLKQEVCDDSIRASYYHTYQMAKTKKYSEKKCKKYASRSAVIHEIMVRGYNNVNYGELKASLGIDKKYNSKFVILMINLYSKFSWGKLLFRRG